MKIRKHFRTESATINYIITDLTLNNINNRDDYFDKCVANRVNMLNKKYDEKLDKIVTFIILRCDFDNLPIMAISKIALSLSKVMNVLTKGFLSMIGDK